MNILLIKCAGLGDVLRTTALLPALRARTPQARFWWRTSPQALPLLEGNPLLTGAFASDELPAALGNERFELVLSLEEDEHCAALRTTLPHAHWVGVTPGEAGTLSFTQDSAAYYGMSLLARDADGGHAAADALKRENRDSFEALWCKILGLDEKLARPSLNLHASDRTRAMRLAHEKGFLDLRLRIGLSPGAGTRWPAKRLPEETTLSLAKGIREKWGVPALLLGGPEEAAEHERLAERSQGALLPVGGLDLRTFAAVVELCHAAVTTDSLTLHAANALRVPTLALFGPTSPHEIRLGRGIKREPEGGCACFYRPRCTLAAPEQTSDAALPVGKRVPQAAPCMARFSIPALLSDLEALLCALPSGARQP
ncbi:MAG: glycosyltransferase family 9 protein [Elusimicrobiota bacterium]|jgi:heptosyltransferase-2